MSEGRFTAWRHGVAAPDSVTMTIEEDRPDQIQIWSETEQPEASSALEAARGVAWSSIGIPRNPEAALQRYAQRRGLGAPLTCEFDFEFEGALYRGQGFAMGIAYVEVNQWGEIWGGVVVNSTPLQGLPRCARKN